MTVGKVLIIEDDDLVRNYIQKVLKFKGLDTKGSPDGETGLAEVLEYLPDIILLDIVMPGKDGYEVCAELKSNKKTKDIPIIFLSSRTQSKDIVRGFELGIVDYITKPFNEYELMSRVITHLELKKSRDIIEAQKTELKITNNQLDIQNHELKKVNDTKDKFFSIISHDLRGPIGGFQQVLELLEDETLDEQDKKDLLHDMKIQTKVLFETLENLLQWSLDQQNEIQYKPEIIEIKDIMLENTALAEAQIQSKSIKFETKYDKKVKIFADKPMLNSVIRNLISNAVKFTPKNGKIILSAYALDEFTEFTVSDTGIGISKENVRRLFQPDVYYTTRGLDNEKGSGLGLKLCKSFVEKNRGIIWVESSEENGTEFKFTVPAATE